MADEGTYGIIRISGYEAYCDDCGEGSDKGWSDYLPTKREAAAALKEHRERVHGGA